MGFWETNLAVVRECYPGLAEQLLAHDDEEGPELRVEAAGTGEPNLRAEGLHVHSPRDPDREGRRLAEAALAEAALAGASGPVIVLGFGLGYAASAASELAPQRPIIIVERRKAILRKALESRELRDFLRRGRLIFVLGGEPSGLTGVLGAVSGRAPGKSALLRNRALMQLDADWYAEAERHIGAWTAKDEVNRATLARFGKRWVRNLAANLGSIRDIPGLRGLEGILPGDIPALLVAAGPSLDRLIPRLPDLAERCVVVAVDTALGLLLRAGLEPDFTVAVDPQFWNGRHLDRAPLPQGCLVAESAVYPPVLRHRAARLRLAGSVFPLGQFIEERTDPKGRLGAGGSVATAAWDFARLLGAGSIWIAGLDLGFPELKTHYKGAVFEGRALNEASRFCPAETRSVQALRDGRPFKAPAAAGGMVLTDKRLSLYAAWFENRFRLYPRVRNYGLGSRGLAIQGLLPAHTADLLALPPRRKEIEGILAAAFARQEAAFTRPEEAAARSARYEAALGALRAGLASVESLAKEASALAEAALADTAAETTLGARRGHLLEQMEALDRAISGSEVKDVAGFLFPETAALERDLSYPPRRPWERHLEFSARLYRALALAAGYHLKCLGAR